MKHTIAITSITPLVCLSGFCYSMETASQKADVKQDAAQKPNVLVIMVDQMATWTLGCYGGNEIGTPNIDALASEGSLLTGFYVSTPVSTPSRGSFMTGLYPNEHGAYKNDKQIRQDVSTWAQALRDAGYQTGYAGKWHLDGNPQRPGWDIRGKDMGWSDRTQMYSFGHYKFIDCDVQGQPFFDPDAMATNPANYPTDWFTDRTLEFIDKHKNGNFCYMLSIPDPHVPYVARAPYNAMYPPSTMKMPATLTEKPKSNHFLYNETRQKSSDPKVKAKSEYNEIVKTLPQNKSQYFGMIKCIDDNIGRMIAYLKANNLYDNTIIVFTADHGDMMGEHGRMAKAVPFDGAARVPFIVRYPAKIKAGTVCDNIASSIDFYPTLLALAGIEQKTKVSGKNMDAILTGSPNVKTWNDKAFYRCYSSNYPWVGVVTKEYKLVYGEKDVNNKALLIDRKKDPSESYNVIDDPAYASVVKSLTKDIMDYCRTHKDTHIEWLEKRIK